MTLEDIYYIGQSVAVLAILASLIGIYFQMRQSQKMEQASSQRAIMVQVKEWNDTTSEDAELLDIVARLLEDYEGGEPHEQVRFSAWCMHLTTIVISAVHLWDAGFIREATYSQLLTTLYGVIETPGGRQWWEKSATRLFSPFVVGHIEQNRNTYQRTYTNFYEVRPEFKAYRNKLKAEAGKS